MNYGYIAPTLRPEDFVFGANKLGDAPVNPGGQWDAWLPSPEDQNLNGIEPYACVSFATNNALEILIRQEFGQTQNLSDRFLAYASGTKARQGNDSATVADTLRKKGNVPEADWPFGTDITTFDAFYATPPQKLYTLALNLTDEFNIGREWVGSTQAEMMAALEFSPLTAGVYAWDIDPQTGYFIRPKGARSIHCVCIYGYERNYYWKVFDSYANETKKLAWDFGFDAVMRYTLHRQIANTPQAQNAWQTFLSLIRSILGLS